ncbi:MAG: hypothetical protein ABW185_03565 [Sedimenticola sp.]
MTSADAAGRRCSVMNSTTAHLGAGVSSAYADVVMSNANAATSRVPGCKPLTSTSWSSSQPVSSAGRIPVLYRGRPNVRHERPAISDMTMRNVDGAANEQASVHDDVTHENDDDEFSEYVRKPPIRYYIGGFKPTITENKLYNYVTKRGLSVTTVTIFPNKRNPDAVTIRLNVEPDSQCHRIEEPYFWPKGITCKPWMNRTRYRRGNNCRLSSREENRVHGGAAFCRRGNSVLPDYVHEYNPYLLPENDVD